MSGQTARDRTSRSSGRASIYLAGTAIALSLSALAMVLGNVAAGAPPQADENSWAHLFQLAIAAQVPLFALFAVTADWRPGSISRNPALRAILLCRRCVGRALVVRLLTVRKAPSTG